MQANQIRSLLVLLLVVLSINVQAQSVTPATASVTGQIKIGDAPARGVSVALIAGNRLSSSEAVTRVTTDADGRYKFTNLAAGTIRITVLSPGYIVFGTSDLVRNGQHLTLKEGEAVERIDFTLTRGGVITGKVLNNNNRPLIGEPVLLTTLDESGKQTAFNPPNGVGGFRTDDRGVYRLYGLPPGKYLVSAGRGSASGGGPGLAATRNYLRTFHPETIDVTQAIPITVESGKEVSEVDIRLVAIETFAATGRVIEAETGRPVPGVLIAHSVVRGGARGQAPSMAGSADGVSGTEGEFRIEGLARGRHSVYVAQDPQNPATTEYYSEPAPFEITTTDATGLEIKLQRGASISGIVVLDGATDPNLLANVRINASVRGSGIGGRAGASTNVAPNGMFRVAGLAPGRISLGVSDGNNPGPFSGLQVLRLEKDGAELQSGVEVAQGEQIAGVRVYVAYGTSSIRGLVRVEGGTLTPDLRLMVMARRTDSTNGTGGGRGGGMMPAQLDAQGQFQINQLLAGTYEVTVQMIGSGLGGGGFGPGFGGGFGGRGGQPAGQQSSQPGQVAQPMRVAPVSQTIVVGNNATQNVTLTLNLAAQVPVTAPGNNNRNPQGNPQRRRP
jgi:hypothetical protein